MKKELFLEDILERILMRGQQSDSTLVADIKVLRDLIQYQRSFDSTALAEILERFQIQSPTTPYKTISLNGLPYPVAHLLQDVNTQSNELVRVLFLCDAVECFVRWRFSEMLTVLHSVNGTLPDASLGQIRNMITKPSMGSWNNGFVHLAKQLSDSLRKNWGVTDKLLNKDIEALQTITQKRNKLAHGDISGGNKTTVYWQPIYTKATQIFDRYRKLNIEHFVVYLPENQGEKIKEIQPELYAATGQTTLTKISKPIPQWTHKINEQSNYFCIVNNGHAHQIPLTFALQTRPHDSNNNPSESDDGNEAQKTTCANTPLCTLSYISTQGKVNTSDGGGSLEYTVIDGEGVRSLNSSEILSEFINIFKLDKDPSSQEPWRGPLEEVNNAIAWNVDRDLLTYRFKTGSIVTSTEVFSTTNTTGKATQQEKNAQAEKARNSIEAKEVTGTFWYIGGKAQSSKSTVLFSWLKNREQKDTTYVFAHRFGNENTTVELDTFFRNLQEALTLWIRKKESLADPNTSLSGEELRQDVDDLLTQFANLEHAPYLLIGLDDIHNLCDPLNESQNALDTLVATITSWSKYTKPVVQQNYIRETKAHTYQGHLVQQIFCVGTALDISVGINQQTDIDQWMLKRSDVKFVYDISTLTKVSPQDENKSDHYPTRFSTQLEPSALERWHEIVAGHQQSSFNPAGSHLPMIATYGTKRLLLAETINPQLVQSLQVQGGRGEKYISELVTLAKGNASIIAAVGENLRNGHISIDDPLTPAAYNTIIPSLNNPFLQDISRLIPLLVVFLQQPEFYTPHKRIGHDGTPLTNQIAIPLTITTLELLCSNGYEPTQKNERYILEALHRIPRLVKRVALHESESNGDLAFGWVLREESNLESIMTSHALELTTKLVVKRIQFLKKEENIANLSDSLQLKSILLQDISGQTMNTTSTVQQIFRDLRNKLNPGIRTVLQGNADGVLHNSASMLYQTSAIAAPQITWLQKADASKTHHEDTEEFIKGKSFRNTFWLRHINTERHAVFNHQLTALGYSDTVQQITCLNKDFYMVVGGKTSVTSISVYNIKRSIPEIEIIPKDSDVIRSCIVHRIDDDTVAIVYSIDTAVYIRIIALGSHAKEVLRHTHDYGATIGQLCSLSETQVGIFGDKDKDGILQIDVLSELDSQTLHCKTLSSGASLKQSIKEVIRHSNKSLAIYNDILIEIAPDQDNTLETASKLTSVPQQDALLTTNGLITIGGSKKTEKNATWYRVDKNKAVTLCDQNNNKKLNLPIFAMELSDERLITIGYKGILRVYKWPTPEKGHTKQNKKTNKAPKLTKPTQIYPVVERQLTIPTEVTQSKVGLNGALMKEARLLLYGVKSFMAYFDISEFLKVNEAVPANSTPHPASHILSKHYGDINDAFYVKGSILERNDLFITISNDNDARLWSFTEGDTDNNTNGEYCIGLFRGHSAKLKMGIQYKETLVTIDDRKNIRTWMVNEGCVNQFKDLPQRNPSFINSAFWYQNQVWVIATEGDSLFIHSYSDDGANWSPQAALKNAASPTYSNNRGSITVDSVIHAGPFLILQVDKRLYTFNLNTQTWAPLALGDEEKGLKVASLKQALSNNTRSICIANDPRHIYTITQSNHNLSIERILTIAEEEVISALCSTSSEDGIDSIHFTTTIDKSNQRVVYELNLDDGTATELIRKEATAQISGLWNHEDDILFWMGTDTKSPREYYLYRKATNLLLAGPKNRLLNKGFKHIHKLPSKNGDGFVFRSGDDDRRWVLKYDYSYGLGNISTNKSLQLEPYTSWVYASDHFDDIILSFSGYPTLLEDTGVFAELIPQGLILHYKIKNTHRNLKLLWTGNSSGTFKISRVLPKGRIILKQNRDLIILQLMKGNKPVCFETLVNSEQSQ